MPLTERAPRGAFFVRILGEKRCAQGCNGAPALVATPADRRTQLFQRRDIGARTGYNLPANDPAGGGMSKPGSGVARPHPRPCGIRLKQFDA
jgi:hypothetical protein